MIGGKCPVLAKIDWRNVRRGIVLEKMSGGIYIYCKIWRVITDY